MPRYVEGVNALVQWVVACVAWLAAFPLTLLVRRNPDTVVVIGRNMTAFADNTKYFYIALSNDSNSALDVVLVTRDASLVEAVTRCGGRAVRFPRWRALACLLRCGTLVVDAPQWGGWGVAALSRGARIVQLWHGAPLKHIELDVLRKRKRGLPQWLGRLLDAQKLMIGRYPLYDDLVVTSRYFADEVFRSAFRANNFPVTGYPRNDALFMTPPDVAASSVVGINVDVDTFLLVSAARVSGRTICLFMPTFRGAGDDTLGAVIDLSRLSRFAEQRGLLIVLKLHPHVDSSHDLSAYPSLIECGAATDVYPLLGLCDILVTDYSSVFFDFLLLDRPVLFLPYDLEDYLSSDRAMYFRYDAMTPGPHCTDMQELEAALDEVLAGVDEYAEARARVRELAHDHCDGNASRRLIRHLGFS